ncbi:MAG: ABC transporter ATP-binding protein [Candidatus Nanopelagicaceae bacterium]
MTAPLLHIDDLHVHFNTSDGIVQAINGASLSLNPGEILGLVGESGSGKSVTAMSILGLVPKPPAVYPKGRIFWKGIDLLTTPDAQLREIRGGEISMIFQDPMTSLNPVYTIGHQISEMIRVHERISVKAAKVRAIEMLNLVGVPNPEQRIDDYPHQFSGGMRQRAMIAMALSCNPELLIADEPTTALDVTIQAQILEILEKSARELNVAVLLITHDLGVVAGICDRVAVMYGGRIVEEAPVDDLYERPLMPYTWGLMKSIPQMDEFSNDPLYTIPGAPPVMSRPPKGCAFAPRCEFAIDKCHLEVPTFDEFEAGRMVRCHRVKEPNFVQVLK